MTELSLSHTFESLITAYCDIIKYLPCYEWVVKEAERYGSKWTKVWAQEKAVKMICSYLPEILSEHVHVVDTELYPEWEHYLKQFLRVGGVIEGTPPSESVTPLAVDLLIEPTGAVKVLCTLDQVLLIYCYVIMCTPSTVKVTMFYCRSAVRSIKYMVDPHHRHLSLMHN